MRAYTAPPTLTFADEDVTELVSEALAVVRELSEGRRSAWKLRCGYAGPWGDRGRDR
jgi:hypothetical protein